MENLHLRIGNVTKERDRVLEENRTRTKEVNETLDGILAVIAEKIVKGAKINTQSSI